MRLGIRPVIAIRGARHFGELLLDRGVRRVHLRRGIHLGHRFVDLAFGLRDARELDVQRGALGRATATEVGDQLVQQRARFDESTKCILCAACTTSCPTFWADGKYVGPAAIVNAHRFIFDSRDRAAAQRLQILNQRTGVWACRTAFNCTEACPRDIQVTKAIAEVKQALLTGKLE